MKSSATGAEWIVFLWMVCLSPEFTSLRGLICFSPLTHMKCSSFFSFSFLCLFVRRCFFVCVCLGWLISIGEQTLLGAAQRVYRTLCIAVLFIRVRHSLIFKRACDYFFMAIRIHVNSRKNVFRIENTVLCTKHYLCVAARIKKAATFMGDVEIVLLFEYICEHFYVMRYECTSSHSFGPIRWYVEDNVCPSMSLFCSMGVFIRWAHLQIISSIFALGASEHYAFTYINYKKGTESRPIYVRWPHNVSICFHCAIFSFCFHVCCFALVTRTKRFWCFLKIDNLMSSSCVCWISGEYGATFKSFTGCYLNCKYCAKILVIFLLGGNIKGLLKNNG